jgi:hypothetical protein
MAICTSRHDSHSPGSSATVGDERRLEVEPKLVAGILLRINMSATYTRVTAWNGFCLEPGMSQIGTSVWSIVDFG